MSDYRTVREEQNAAKALKQLCVDANENDKVLSKNKVLFEMKTNFKVSRLALRTMIEEAISIYFNVEGDNLIPKSRGPKDEKL